MAKFRDVAAGAQARKLFDFPLPSGTTVPVALVPLFGESEAEVFRDARLFAIERGLPDPKKGDELYELGLWVATIVRGVVDPDSPQDAPVPFFDSVAQIMDPRKGLGREWIALLFEAQQAWQDEISPRPKAMGAVEYFQAIAEIVEAPPHAEIPFFRWRRGLQASFLRTLCATFYEVHLGRSTPGAPSLGTFLNFTSSVSTMTDDAKKPNASEPKPEEPEPPGDDSAPAGDAQPERLA